MPTVPKPPGSQATEGPPGDLPPVPSRRRFVRSIALTVVAAWPAWIVGARPLQKIIVVDCWILADTDLR